MLCCLEPPGQSRLVPFPYKTTAPSLPGCEDGAGCQSAQTTSLRPSLALGSGSTFHGIWYLGDLADSGGQVSSSRLLLLVIFQVGILDLLLLLWLLPPIKGFLNSLRWTRWVLPLCFLYCHLTQFWGRLGDQHMQSIHHGYKDFFFSYSFFKFQIQVPCTASTHQLAPFTCQCLPLFIH